MATQNQMERNENSAYFEALKRVAKEAGLSPEELEKRIYEASKGLEYTPECLTLRELETYPDLAKARIEHTGQCSFCQRLVQVADARVEEIEKFAREAASQENFFDPPILAELENRRVRLNRFLEISRILENRPNQLLTRVELEETLTKTSIEIKKTFNEIEKTLIFRTLHYRNWNVRQAAQDLGIGRLPLLGKLYQNSLQKLTPSNVLLWHYRKQDRDPENESDRD